MRALQFILRACGGRSLSRAGRVCALGGFGVEGWERARDFGRHSPGLLWRFSAGRCARVSVEVVVERQLVLRAAHGALFSRTARVFRVARRTKETKRYPGAKPVPAVDRATADS